MNRTKVTNIKTHPWEKSYPEGVNWVFNSTDKPIYSIIEDAAHSHPDRICIDFLGREYSYSEMMGMTNQVAYGLQEIGIKKGDRIGICLPNCPYFVAAYFGALKIGATVVNFNPLYTEDELNHQINDSGIKVMFTIDLHAIYNKVNNCMEGSALSKIIVCSLPGALTSIKGLLFKLFKSKELINVTEDEGHINFACLISHGDKPKPVKINPAKDLALLQYTGGTTGIPKGAMLTHENVSSNAAQVRMWLGDNVNPDGEVFLGVLPFFHVFAMTAVMNLGITLAAKIIMTPRFELDKTLELIHKEKPTIFPGVPTIFNAINNHNGVKNYDLSSINWCISGGATLPEQVKDGFKKLTNCVLVEGYGLSEASPVIACNPPHTGGKNNSIGIPVPGTLVEIRNLKDNKKVVKTGERGEVFAKGPQIMSGYWENKEATKKTIVDGWLKTGDVGYMDKDGYIFLTDRLKEIIITGGYNVYPKIIEEAFYKHKAVEEVIVIGIPDKDKGEEPKAFVKLKSGAKASAEELLQFACDNLNPIEKPIAVEIREELPKTLIGKLSKKELVAEEKMKKETS